MGTKAPDTSQLSSPETTKCCLLSGQKFHFRPLEVAGSHLQTDAVLLALGLGVGVVTSEDEAVAGEGGLRHARHDGVVHAGLPRDGVLQPVDGVVAFVLHGQDGGEGAD